MVTAMNSSFASLPLSLSFEKCGESSCAPFDMLRRARRTGDLYAGEREEAHRNTCSGGKYFHAL